MKRYINDILTKILTLTLLLILGASEMWGQTNYSGTYFLSGNNQGQDSYNIANTTTNYYLCPTVDWIYYKADATNYFTNVNNGQPFITTYQYRGTNDASEAVWRFVKHASLNYYYIIHNKSGKYLVSNQSIKTATSENRLRVHLEETAPTETTQDYYLFAITNTSNYFNISPKKYGNYLNTTQGNQPSLQGTSTEKNDGPTGEPTAPDGSLGYNCIGGTIGLWTKAAESTSKWYIELFTPEISIDNCTFTLSYPIEDNTVQIRYTTDGTAPTASSTLYTEPFTPGLDAVQIKVTAFKTGISAIKSPTVSYDFSKLPAPTCELNEAEGKLTLNTSVENGIIYYKTGGDDPTIDDNIYTEPLSVSEGTIVKAFVAKQCNAPSDIFSHEIIKVATPTFELLEDNRVKISSETEGVTIYYSIGDNLETIEAPNTLYTSPLIVETGKYFKAIAMKNGCLNSDVATTSEAIKLKCAKPSIKRMGKKINVGCSFPSSGYTIKYTIADNGGTPADPNSSSSSYTELIDISDKTPPITIKAYVLATGYSDSDNNTFTLSSWGNGTEDDPYIISTQDEFNSFVSNVNTNSNNEADKYYQLIVDVNGGSAITTPFRGSLVGIADDENGSLPTISGLNHALFNTINGGTVKNIILDNVSISGGTNAGAICNEATGDSRIYNCGVLATSSTAKTDENGYTYLTNVSSSISGSGYVGSIVGLLGGTSRVINCFSYANVSGGSYVGGIAGYNNVAYNATDHKTMVMNCMFYGEVSGSSIAPIYNGAIITNDGDADGVNNFNYFRLESSYIKNAAITKVYNCALGAETRFLQRFEFYRHLLNSNRELAAWWATDDTANKDEMMKWVLEPSQIGSSTPYPILKAPGYYASVVNYPPSTTAYDEANRNKGCKLTGEGDGGVLHVTISMGTGGAQYLAPSGAGFKSGETGKFDLTITDKDYEHFNFNYGKVQLPYYNDYCDGNYTGNRVVTGWKITSITGGTAGSYSTGADDVTFTNGELTATPYNFADRKCKNKDLYSVSNRVFNQGAYWDVPEGVTSITIEPYWGKAVYLSDAYWDIVYQNGTGGQPKDPGSQYDAMTTAIDVTTVGGTQHYENGVSTFNGQTVFTSMGNAIASSGTALYSGTSGSTNHTVYDYAVVLVGNYHHTASIEADSKKPYTVTSVDLDGDNEPDYSLMLRFNSRTGFHPVRYDFLNLIGLGMAQKTTGGTGSYNLGIMQPKYWFEVTNTALFRVTQFEYSPSGRAKKPIILQGGVIEQWVTQQQDAGDAVEYFHVGGNVWFKEFHRGSHQDNTDKKTPHPPVSVTGGDFDKFYLTGYYQSQAAICDDNAECYINGGRFGEVAGAGMEGIGAADGNKGNITWVIDNADITEFYGGGINADKPIHGNIYTIIKNSHVTQFCGGPKFGDMEDGRTVNTIADKCTFGTYFGAGYGGNSYSRFPPKNYNEVMNVEWNNWIAGTSYPSGGSYGGYKLEYNSGRGGIATQLDYQFIPMSGNTTNVARLFIDYVSFSLATTHNVSSTLNGCTINGNFYGGGNLGKVDGNVTSTLTNCMVNGNVFGAGYSASKPTVEVMPTSGFITEPRYDEQLGSFIAGVLPSKEATTQTTTYTWKPKEGDKYIDTNKGELYTTVDLSVSNLGSVSGAVTLNLNGNTKVGTMMQTVNQETNETISSLKDGTGNVYGGGDSSYVYNEDTLSNAYTVVNIAGNTEVFGNVFGGGNNGEVSGSATVNIVQTLPTTTNNSGN